MGIISGWRTDPSSDLMGTTDFDVVYVRELQSIQMPIPKAQTNELRLFQHFFSVPGQKGHETIPIPNDYLCHSVVICM